jgi:hypothetical protein
MTRTDPRRLAVVEEAQGWLGTPYHHMGRVKGAGTDCLMMLAAVYEAGRVIPHLEILFYPADWNLHRGAEPYLDGVMRHASEISGRHSQAASRFVASAAATPMGRSRSNPRAGCRWGNLWRRHAAKASQPQATFFRSIR